MQRLTFLPEFHADLSRYKWRQNFITRFEFGLHMPVKLYPDSLRFAGVIREKPILSKYCTQILYAVMHLHDSGT